MSASLGKLRAKLSRWWLPITVVLAAAVLIAWRFARSWSLMITGLSLSELNLPCSGIGNWPELRQHPTARLIASSITPEDSIGVGEQLHATARMDCSKRLGRPLLYYTDREVALMYDNGTHGDHVPFDGVWEVDVVLNDSNFFEGTCDAEVILGMTGDYSFIEGNGVTLKEKPAPQALAGEPSRPPGAR